MDIEKLKKLVEDNRVALDLEGAYDVSGFADPSDPSDSPEPEPLDKVCLKGYEACANGGSTV